MNIQIIATESLGVRSMCCYVETAARKILIDPGIALGYTRYGLHPHPYQVAVGEIIKKRIMDKWSEATDVVISHFHGDHIPLIDANPYQLDLKKLVGSNPDIRIWTRDSSSLSIIEKKRAEAISSVLKKDLIEAEGKENGVLTFSKHMPHGESKNGSANVMMTKVEEDKIFVHASDIQLLNDEAVLQILDWRPDIVFVDGPPLYLSKSLSKKQIGKAWDNAVKLSQKIYWLIIDHHLMRSFEGESWLEYLFAVTGKKVMCGADFMGEPRILLEARRKILYEDMDVPQNWHKMYASGRAKTGHYIKMAKDIYGNKKTGGKIAGI